jgi:hypothetical protein
MADMEVGQVVWVEGRTTRSGKLACYGKIINIFKDEDDGDEPFEILVCFDNDKDHGSYMSDQMEWFDNRGSGVDAGQWRISKGNQTP